MSQLPKKTIQVPQSNSGRTLRTRGRGSVGMKITIKPSPEVVKQQEEAKLRAQVEKEISERGRVCSHKSYPCTLPVLPDSQYCARHVLQDPTAPYKQCAHVYPSGRKCPLPAPHPTNVEAISKQSRFCFEHARAALAAKQRSTAPPALITTTETLLNSLHHYVKTERVRTTSCASAVSVVSDPADEQNVPYTALDPFKQMDARYVNNCARSLVMEACSGSESDADSVTLGRSGSNRAPADGRLNDPHPSPLRYAGVYTAEEAVSEARSSLKRLQTAYTRQMSRLRLRLQAERAIYLRSLRLERENNCSIHEQARRGPLGARERRRLKKLKAYAGYHRKHGTHAVLARKLYRKRAKLSQGAPGPSRSRCLFTEGGVRCDAQSLPATRYCFKHVLLDAQQVLYEECGERREGLVCAEPVPRVGVYGLSCRYHQRLPAYTVFAMKKDETDSESDTNTVTESAESQAGGECEEAQGKSIAEM